MTLLDYKWKTFSTWNAGADRLGEIIVCTNRPCYVCGETTKVLGIDSSEGEYGAGFICLHCACQAFAMDMSDAEKGKYDMRYKQCRTNPVSSRVCEKGTKCCDIFHDLL